MRTVPWSFFLGAIVPLIAVAADAPAPAPDAFRAGKMLGRGINLGNALEAPSEGEWGLTIKDEYFDRIKEAGFQSVRIPIRWATHTGPAPDFAVDPKYFDRIDRAIDGALSRGLVVVINAHHDDELYKEPDRHQARLEATWRAIASRYRNRDDRLFFELLNEPNGALTDDRWQAMFPGLLAIVRESNPNRAVIVGPGHWNDYEHLSKLELPESDRMLIATFHYYRPFHFTHQGAEWTPGSDAWKGQTWTGTPEQRATLKGDFEKVARWAAEHKRPIYLGEFGSYHVAEMSSRATWTAAVAREAERHGFTWAYWEFAAGFGAFDKEAGRWRGPIKDALIPPGPAPSTP